MLFLVNRIGMVCRQFLVAQLLAITIALSCLAEDTALIFSPEGAYFEEVIDGLSKGLGEKVNIEKHLIDRKTEIKEIVQKIDQYTPNIIVLIGNISVNLYEKYQNSRPGQNFPPSLVVAALYADILITKVSNATAIRYEFSIATGIASINPLLSRKIKKVGLIHREFMSEIVDEEVRYSASHGIELMRYVVKNRDANMGKTIKRGLRHLIVNDVDAIWVVNDSALLDANALRTGWLHQTRLMRIPVIVGVEPLVSRSLNIGSFAILPDHTGLGVQASAVIVEIMDDGWVIKDPSIKRPIALRKIVNTAILKKKKIPYIEKQLSTYDKELSE